MEGTPPPRPDARCVCGGGEKVKETNRLAPSLFAVASLRCHVVPPFPEHSHLRVYPPPPFLSSSINSHTCTLNTCNACCPVFLRHHRK